MSHLSAAIQVSTTCPQLLRNLYLPSATQVFTTTPQLPQASTTGSRLLRLYLSFVTQYLPHDHSYSRTYVPPLLFYSGIYHLSSATQVFLPVLCTSTTCPKLLRYLYLSSSTQTSTAFNQLLYSYIFTCSLGVYQLSSAAQYLYPSSTALPSSAT
jgi:hypothetical protein